MTFPNFDNTFLASLQLYRRLRGGKWYLRHYKQTPYLIPEARTPAKYGTLTVEWEAWCRYGGKSPMSYVVKSEVYE